MGGARMISGSGFYVPRPEMSLPRRPATVSSPRRPRGRLLSTTGREPCGDRFGIDPASISIAAGDAAIRPSKVRTFDNIPMMQSSVDQVVFNRDVDGSGETKFDEEFMKRFEGMAG